MAEESSQELDALARNIAQLILQGIADKGGERIGDVLGCDKSTVTRLKEEQLPRLAKLIAYLGYKIVPIEARVYDVLEQDFINSMLKLTGRKIFQAPTANDFFQ